MDSQSTYARISGLSIVYTVLLCGLLFTALGDHNQVMNVYAWYAPQFVWAQLVVWDSNRYRVYLHEVDPFYQRLIRFLGFCVALGENIGMLVWASLRWSWHPQQPVWPATVGMLIVVTLVSLPIVLLSGLALLPWRRPHAKTEMPPWVELPQDQRAASANIRPSESV